jgi:hypothetical protein
MGTNFYARLIPTKKRKQELHEAIDNNNVSMVQTLVHEMYDSIYIDWNSNEIKGGCVHLGKRSGGWKFLWNPNVFVVRNGHSEWVEHSDGSKSSKWVKEPDTAKYTYPLTKEGIKAFIDREDVKIYDEYGEFQDKEEFWQMALNWTTWRDKEAWDAATYEAENFGEHHYKCSSDLIDLLEREGFEFTSDTCSDFYSDGLRFATSTEFS